MTLGDLFGLSLLIGLFALLALMFIGAFRFRPSRVKGLDRREKLGRFARYVAVRLPLAIGVGVALFVLGAAALTLNSHRPPGDNSPVITLPTRSGEGTVNLEVKACDGDVTGQVRYGGRLLGNSGRPQIYSDFDGRQRLDRLKSFELSDPLARRGLLSCYLQLPVLRGAEAGYEIRLSLGDDMEVDTMASVPAPHAYDRGEWIWRCPAGQTCPGVATVSYAIEGGTKQVIVLVLASVFGALIALLTGEVLIKWAQRRFNR